MYVGPMAESANKGIALLNITAYNWESRTYIHPHALIHL